MTDHRNSEPSDPPEAGEDEGQSEPQESTPSPGSDAEQTAVEDQGPASDPSGDEAAGDDDEEDSSSPPPTEADEDSSSPPPVSASEDEEAGRSDDESPSAAAGEDEGEAKPRKPAQIQVDVYGRTDVGQIREHNEDNLLVADLDAQERGGTDDLWEMDLGLGGALFAVCDGMGGAAAGEIASQLAVDIVYERMRVGAADRDRDRLAMAMVEALEFAGMRILNESNKNRACRGMGTTATVAALVDDHLLLGQVGDSRGYLLRDERLVQVTRDQSLVNQLIEAGQLTEEEAENFEHSNIILQALGTADAVQVDLTYAELRRGDMLLLCSDGLSGMIRDDEVRDIMLRGDGPVEICHQLIDEANEAGGHDNVTAIIAVFDGDDLQPVTAEDALALRYSKYALPAWMNHGTMDGGAGAGYGMGASAYDDTPYIEIHGEIELGPDDDWEDLFDDSPHIPTEAGPSWSTLAIVAAVIGVLVLVYFLSR